MKKQILICFWIISSCLYAQDVDYSIPNSSAISFSTLSDDVYSLILPLLSPLDRKRLIMTGDRQAISKINRLIKQKVGGVLNQLEGPVLHGESKVYQLYTQLSFSLDDYTSVYNLMLHADELLSYEPFQTPEFIDFLSACGYQKAAEMKFDGYFDGRYSYQPSSQLAKEFLDEQAEFYEWAARKKLEYMVNGWLGYSKDVTAENAFIEEYARTNCEWAIQAKISGLAFGKYGYQIDLDMAKTLLELQVSLRRLWAIRLKLEALTRGGYGYTEDETIGRDFLELLVLEKNEWAIRRKIWGLTNGAYGYSPNKREVRKILYTCANLKQTWAMKMRVEALSKGWHGHSVNHKRAHGLLLVYFRLGYDWAVEMKFQDLAVFDDGSWISKLMKRSENLRNIGTQWLLEKYEALDQQWAIVERYKALRQGLFGYPPDADVARRFLFRKYNIKIILN